MNGTGISLSMNSKAVITVEMTKLAASVIREEMHKMIEVWENDQINQN